MFITSITIENIRSIKKIAIDFNKLGDSILTCSRAISTIIIQKLVPFEGIQSVKCDELLSQQTLCRYGSD